MKYFVLPILCSFLPAQVFASLPWRSYDCESIARVINSNGKAYEDRQSAVLGFVGASNVGLRPFIHKIEGQTYQLAGQIGLGSYLHEPKEEFSDALYEWCENWKSGPCYDTSSFEALEAELPHSFALSLRKSATPAEGVTVLFRMKCKYRD